MTARQKVMLSLSPRYTERLDRLAADAGVSRSELVRRLIDQEEQRMSTATATYAGWTIEASVFTGNLFAGDWNLDEIDARVSANRYAEQVEAEIEREYPGARVEVPVLDAEGCCPGPRVLDAAGLEQDDAQMVVDEILGRVYEAQEWVVNR